MTARPVVRHLVLFMLALMLAACATSPEFSSDADPQANFSTYRTFAFYAPLAAESKGYATPSSKAMRDQARHEMESRGYVYDESAPDLLVNINAFITERTDVVPDMSYGYYYGYRPYGYFPGPYWGSQTYVRNYSEGTVNVDLVDARGKNLVWEGLAVGRVPKTKPVDRTARVRSAIADIFAMYPHRAGN